MTDLTPILTRLERIEAKLSELTGVDVPPLTIAQAAERWDKSPSTVLRYGREGKLKINPAGLISMAEVERFEKSKKHVNCNV